jgi:hypothetical protein
MMLENADHDSLHDHLYAQILELVFYMNGLTMLNPKFSRVALVVEIGHKSGFS